MAVPDLAPLDGLGVTAIVLLLLSVLALWTGSRTAIGIAAGAAVVTGYAAGILDRPAAIPLLAIAVSAWRLRATDGWRRAVWLAVTLTLGLLLGLHLLPGFSNPPVMDDVVLSDGARPYSQHVNFDKTLGAVLLLAGIGWAPIRTSQDWRTALGLTLPLLAIVAGAVMAASLALGFVRVDPHWSPLFWIWAPINLLTTCVSEETFFRGLLQEEVRRAAPPRHATAVAVTTSALLFGVAHAAGGWRYVLLATLAGAGYASAYARTGRLEMAILTHFIVNAVHFLLFTYPALA